MHEAQGGNAAAIICEIQRLRAALRYHRGQLGDYRCWVDDVRVYQAANLTSYRLPQIPNTERFEAYCQAFWENRQRPAEKGKGDLSLNSERGILPLAPSSDDDLQTKALGDLQSELIRLREGIERHELRGFLGRTAEDDEQLYALLPERTPWNSALPPREVFLPHCREFCSHCQKRPEHFFEWSQEKMKQDGE